MRTITEIIDQLLDGTFYEYTDEEFTLASADLTYCFYTPITLDERISA